MKTFISSWVLHLSDFTRARTNSEPVICVTMAVWVITGASRGIGLELVKQLVARGDVVVGAARNPETCSALKELESSSSGKLHLVKMDVEDPDTIKVLGEFAPDVLSSNVSAAAQRFGTLYLNDIASEYCIPFLH